MDPKPWVLLAVGTGTFMSALDGSAVNTVLPVVTRSFATDVATIEWVSHAGLVFTTPSAPASWWRPASPALAR